MTKPSPAWIDSSSRRKDVCTCASADHPRKISTPEKTNIFLSFMGLYVGFLFYSVVQTMFLG